MSKPKVSIVSPVYNGSSYIKFFLDSILNQSYDSIELIIVDDGSSDDTRDIIQSYTERFDERGIKLQYIFQENGGQMSAIANGIRYATGDYFVWPDTDDFYNNDSLEALVDYLERNPGKDLVVAQSRMVSEADRSKSLGRLQLGRFRRRKQNLFYDYVFERGVHCFTGVYMIRFSKFKQINPELYFYNSRGGQNWQILLPVLYCLKHGYLAKDVHNYVIREDSHSHAKRNSEGELKRINDHEEIITKTVEWINDQHGINNFLQLSNKISNKYKLRRYLLDLNLGQNLTGLGLREVLRKMSLGEKISALMSISKVYLKRLIYK